MVDIERAFDSLYHGFLLAVLKNLALGIILWIVSKYKLIRNLVLSMAVVLYVSNLEKRSMSRRPTFYLCIINLEIIFAMIKSNLNIKGLNIFSDNYIYTAYADHILF